MICSRAPIFKFFSAPPDGASTEYKISNREFFDFLRTYYCDFPNNVKAYSYGNVSLVVAGNGKQVLHRYCSASKEALLLFLVLKSACYVCTSVEQCTASGACTVKQKLWQKQVKRLN